MPKKSPRPGGEPIKNGITTKCVECGAQKHLKHWRQDVQEKLDAGTYLCASCNQRGSRARGFAKPGHWTEEKRRQQSIRTAGENNPMFGVDWRTLADSETIKNHRENLSRANQGENNPMHGRSFFEFMDSEAEASWRISNARVTSEMKSSGHFSKMGLASSAKPYRMTRPERLVRAWLEEHNLEHTYGYRLENRSYDFGVGNTLVEVHGDYWHANPLIYGEGKKPLNETQLNKVAIDVTKKEIASRHNKPLLIIWEHEINQGDYSALHTLLEMKHETNTRETH